MKKRIMVLTVLIAGVLATEALAQSAPAYAFKNVTIHQADGSSSESSTVVWRNGVIEAVGQSASVPFDAFVVDGGDSLHVYPGLIDGLALWGSPEQPDNLKPLPEPGDPPYDRAGVQPERTPSNLLTEDKSFEAAMKSGFTTAALQPKGFMLPGQVEVFTISTEHANTGLYKESIALGGAFKDAPGGWSTGAYPSTLMGVMAKFRQLMFDAKALRDHINYYNQNPEMPTPNRSGVLEALFPLVNNSKPLYFEVDSKENIERLFRLQDQFGFDVVIVSGKEAYAKAEALKRRNIPVLASIDVSDAPEWYVKSQKEEEDQEKKENEEDSAEKDEDERETEEKEEPEEISEEEQAFRDRQIQAWKDEVQNIRKLLDAGVQTGYASVEMDLKDFNKKVKVLLDEGGLTEDDLLKVMTVNTAQVLGIDAAFGMVSKGKNASFTVFDKPMTEKKAKVLYNISNGTIHEF